MKTKSSVKDVMYGSITELMNNRQFFYKSSISKWDYSHWTDEGKAEVANLMQFIAVEILRIEEQALEDKAKDMVMDKLKGN